MLDLLLLGLLAVPFAMLFILIGGWINVKITGSNDVAFFKQTFFSLLMGTFFTVSLYAVIMTYGKTIFIIPLLVILYLVWKGRKNEFIFDKKYFLKSILVFTVGTLIISLLNGIMNQSKGIDTDLLFYSGIVDSIQSHQTENFYTYFNSEAAIGGAMPYHYFEFYLASLINILASKMAPWSTAILLKYSCYTLLKVTVFIGWTGLMESFEVKKKWLFGMGLLVPLLGYLTYFNVFVSDWSMFHNMWQRPNFIPYFMGIIFFFIAWKDGTMKYIVMAILFLASASSVLVPFLFLSSSAFCSASLTILKPSNRKENLKLAGLLVLYVVFIAAFYIVFAQGLKSSSPLTIDTIIAKISAMYRAIIGQSLKLMLATISFGLLSFLILLSVRKLKETYNKLLAFILMAVLIACSGIICFQLFSFVDNMYQLPYIGYCFLYLFQQ